MGRKRPGFKDITVFETVYRQLLTTARSVKPDLLFVLGIPFIYEVGKIEDDWPHWKEAVEQRALIVRKLAAEFNGVLVDYPAVFNAVIEKTPAEYWIWDGIHPTVPAHELMAREWIKRVAGRLPFLKKYAY